MKKAILIFTAGVALVVSTVVTIMYFTYNNREIDLSTQITAQNKVIENYYDKMWKILKQKAGITEKYRDSFKDIYVGIMKGRYSDGGGEMMKWIQESNPQFDASLYKDLMNSVEVERTGFYNAQNRLIDMSREHTNLLRKAPSRWFIDAQPIPIRIITSDQTESVIKSGKDNNIEL